MTCCLGGEQNGSQVAVIRKKISLLIELPILLLCTDTEILSPVIIQCSPHSCHSSGFNVNSAFHYRQFVIGGEVLP